MKKNIIFGASKKGIEALKHYGKEQVAYFCDNDPNKIGDFVDGIEVICIHDLYKMRKEIDVIIASAYEDEIIKQLTRLGLNNYRVFNNKKEDYIDEKIKLDLDSLMNLNVINSSHKNNRKIKVRFFFQMSIKWKAIESIYYAFLKDKSYDVKIISIPRYGVNDWKILDNNGVNYIRYDEYNIIDDSPDIVFYNEADDTSRPIEFNSLYVSSMCKVVYIEGTLHNLVLNEKWIQGQITAPIFEYAWKVIISDNDYYNLVVKNSNNKLNKVNLSNPRWDNIYLNINKQKSINSEWYEKIKNKKVILWNPHFYIQNQNSSTFHIWIEYMLKTFWDNNKFSLIIRPHPNLFKSLKNIGIWTNYEINKFREFINNSDNIILDESIDYVGAFYISDALISDMSTFLLSYLPTKKPILYLEHPEHEIINDKNSLEFYYKAVKEKDVNKFLEDSIEIDPLYKKRMDFLYKKVGKFDGKAGERIKEYIHIEYTLNQKE
ncbi:TPR/glycosyl transferase domain-containing protein [Clostridium neonatale]|uniref:CDP-glycerol glycerophosphotransferase family protein n=1 Tax=Clostridium TaxID=1485 RepID=UPI00290C1633|nr:CDP-glycerol glycerophosphotransferase family protein [Clostridium sp.]MDU4478591.1 hypothetical protein [Clostridium sp.]CAI3672839.1 TPR/glycosyl transferase domain-containing protein [Clostridium neonatale]